MNIFVVLDEKNGMLFNNRRQSKDSRLRENMLEECAGRLLWMNGYTAKQFGEDLPENIVKDEDFLQNMNDEEYCFVENIPLSDYVQKINKIIIYRWDKVYPADRFFDVPMEDRKLVLTEEFEGTSHKKITKEVWVNE